VGKALYFYIGTYTEPILFGTGEIMQGKGEGIYLYKMDLSNGGLSFCDVFRNIPNPSYLAVSPSGNFLFCVNELKNFQGEVSGSVSSFSIDRSGGKLTFRNAVSTHGGDPCYVCVNEDESYVYAANFMSGSVSLFPAGKDGTLGEASCVVQHEGSGVHPKRQQGPHAHSVVFDHKRGLAYVPDLGIDRVIAYKTDSQSGTLLPDEASHIVAAPGSGPRHCVFNRGEDTLYVINELSLCVSVYAYDDKKKAMVLLQDFNPVKKESEDHLGADIDIHPNGKFLYASIRGQDVIVCCGIDPKTRKLNFLSQQGCGGKTPRNFSIDPTGRYMLVGNQDTDNVVVFSIDEKTGTLTETFRMPVPTPVCIKPIWL
jgi:6-phosphogluconolactonase